ncbi:TadE-like protein [Marininema mesophilum]|uniref:TadE-like protein n=1 Tax=Marininema mesophilum TaxID=1048340 RepID=A0A1H2X4T1_9BACL|nr:TadE/TadG family type IV pilus assembly protein [Marininema mesophilum]SDW87913.1 TadE-like protein [Marininema mesophilum]
MKIWRNRRGAITVEFVAILPLLLLTACFIWQMAICVMAVVETENTMRDQVRYAASTGNIKKAERDGKRDFGMAPDYYRLKTFDVYKKKRDNHIKVRAETKIRIIFLPSKEITYRSHKQAIIIN